MDEIVTKPCECEQQGYCPRYSQKMQGRYWQFCQGSSGLTREKELKYLQALIDPPSIIKKATNFAKATLEHIATGSQEVPPDIKRQRLEICHENKCNHYKKEDESCKECGCFLDIKTSWADQECPLFKIDGNRYWEKYGDQKKQGNSQSVIQPISGGCIPCQKHKKDLEMASSVSTSGTN